VQPIGPTSEASRAVTSVSECALCGQAMSAWFAAPVLRAADGSQAILQVCRGCFWRSPARSLTGWGRGAQWISPDLLDSGAASRQRPAEEERPGAGDARPDQGRWPAA
jgi:hypothetical protein